MPKYTRKPLVVDAFQWDGHPKAGSWPMWAQLAVGQRRLVYYDRDGHPRLRIHTPGGPLDACRDHWIILDSAGLLHHETSRGFEAAYEAVDD
jgi:hypothetical protein